MKKTITIILIVILILSTMTFFACSKTAVKYDDVKFIFVHGLSGWGSYDFQDKFLPYWGMRDGSVIKYLKKQGYDVYSASVDPTGSAHDRACELYAQLTGSRVDYGAKHSQDMNHERFGKDFSKKPLIEDFENSKLVLIGHSFGGTTIRILLELLNNGDIEERDFEQDDISPLFLGGDTNRVKALVTLSTPNNGTTAYDIGEDESFNQEDIEIPSKFIKYGDMVSKYTKPKEDGKSDEDRAAFDMHIDNAQALNAKLETFENVYYFAYPFSFTTKNEDGNYVPKENDMEIMFVKSSYLMGAYTGVTKNGFVIDETWKENDGLVNTVSAKAPIGAPYTLYDENATINKGEWVVMETLEMDHMGVQGGLTKKHKVKDFYLELVQMLYGLE